MLKHLLFFIALVFSSNNKSSKQEEVTSKKVGSKNRIKFLNLDDFGMGIENPLDLQEENVKFSRSRKDSNMMKAEQSKADQMSDRLDTKEKSPSQLFRKRSLYLTNNMLPLNVDSEELLDHHMFTTLY